MPDTSQWRHRPSLGPTSRDEAVATVSDAAAGITFLDLAPSLRQGRTRFPRRHHCSPSRAFPWYPRLSPTSADFDQFFDLCGNRRTGQWSELNWNSRCDERVVSTTLPTGGGRSIAVLLRTAARLTFAYLVVPSTLYYWWLDLKRNQHTRTEPWSRLNEAMLFRWLPRFRCRYR